MNSKSFVSSIIAVAVLTLGHGVAEATTIRTGIGFEASDFVGDFGTTPPQDFVSGTILFTFDDDLVGPHFITPDAVDLTIAGFTYSVADVTIYFDFSVIIFGGNAGGVFGGGGGTDDFLFLLDRIAIQDSYFEYLTSSTNDIYTSTTLSLRGVSQPPLVPEPSSLALLATGTLALLVSTRRRARS